MKEYTYDEIDLSNEYVASFSIQITAEMMDKFKDLSGDENPLHTDEDYAKMGGFDGRVVYGMLSASWYSKLVGMYLPGKYCLLERVDTHFHKPIYVGDILKVSGLIKKKVAAGRTIVLNAKIENQNGDIVNTAKIQAGCLK